MTPRQKFQPRRRKNHSRDHHKVMTSSITWSHIRIVSLKVIKSLQDKESHNNTQKLDQDIRFTPRRTWQKEWRRHHSGEGVIDGKSVVDPGLTTGQHHIGSLMGCCHRDNVSRITGLLFVKRFCYVGKSFGPLDTPVTIPYGNVN